jgi:arylsulfatase A-like enzyme/Tfp pilus assembly protein PilF
VKRWARNGAVLSAAAVAAIALAWVAWRTAVTPAAIVSGACRGCNVLLITIDTLRADRVGAFGGRPGLTPNLDRLAHEGLRLTRAYAAAPLTLPSHASILTAVSPPVHGVRTNGLFRLGPTLPTLATVLKSAGYRTGAFVGAFVLDARFGLTRGFDVYDDRYGEKHPGDAAEGAERRAEDVIKPGTAWILAGRGSSWFAWLHLYDPHEPYRAPEPYASRYEPYDAEVAYTDAMVGRLLANLKPAGQLDRTLVMVAADHGESLGEHGERTHGVFTYDVTMRVPWIIWAGARIAPRAYDGLARLIDVAPTALDLVGVAPPPSFEGRSALPALNGREAPPSTAYIEAMDANLTRNWAPLTGVVAGHDKLIELPIPELYDLAADPHETTNLFARQGERVRRLGALLRNQTAAFASVGSAVEPTTLSAESRQRLQALGYVASRVDSTGRTYTDADDPKALIGVSNDLNDAVKAFNAGSRAPAMAAVREIIRQHPQYPTAHGMLASMLRDNGDLPGAVATLEGIARRGIADQRVMVVLAGYLQEAGALEKSADLLQAVIASHPDYAEAYNSFGEVSSRLGRHTQARAAYRKVLEMDPTSATAYENLGVDEARAGDRAAAVADLMRALDLDPGLAGAHNALATVYMQEGRAPEAIAHWKTAVHLDPRSYDALYNLGIALLTTNHRDEARPYLERFVDEAPASRYAGDIDHLRALIADKK